MDDQRQEEVGRRYKHGPGAPQFDVEGDDEDVEEHPIFEDIEDGNLGAVQQRVVAEAAVLEERDSICRKTPLMAAIFYKKPAIALLLLQHRGQHNMETAAAGGWTALHYASWKGPLEVVQALVAAGANAAALDGWGSTPLILASYHGDTDIVAFLLQLQAVKASIDVIDQDHDTALSRASFYGRQPTVQRLLDAGADPTIPAGPYSPLNRALNNNHHAIAALLRHAIAEAERPRFLHKARSLLGARVEQLACLQGRVEQGQALPQLGFARRGGSGTEKPRATAAFAVGASGGLHGNEMCEDLYLKLLGYLLPGAWADKGPEA